ncbi:hypothetical protein [Rheinheimera hassiensis]|uniref:hypothetical protein n=1 Tax=Rheinheimera hassiensis TaxID=1193627 RepID=UPI001F06FB32|nr:hypothetical protein [Rheinheimera hassiensis]
MVRRYLSAFKAFIVVAATFLAWGGVSQVSANQTSNPAAAQSIPVTHIVKYGRREYRLSGGDYFICKGNYLSYDNYRCKRGPGVDPLTAERSLTQDIIERYGTSAVILGANVLHPPGAERRLEVQVGLPINGMPSKADQYANFEFLYQYPNGYWAQKDDDYYVCGSGEISAFSEQYACLAPRTFADWLIGKKVYTQPITVLNHIQQKNEFAADIVNMHVDSNKSLRVTYRKAGKYNDDIINAETPAVIGNSRPKWLESIGMTEYADALVTVLLLISLGMYVLTIKTESVLHVSIGLGFQLGSWLAFDGSFFLIFTSLAPLLYIHIKKELREESARELRNVAMLRERASTESRYEARQPRVRRELDNIDALRGSSEPVQINEVSTPETPTAEPGTKPVRKIILD